MTTTNEAGGFSNIYKVVVKGTGSNQEKLSFLLGTAEGYEIFSAFLMKEFSNENLQFFMAIQKFEKEAAKWEIQEIRNQALRLYKMYIQEGAPLQINITGIEAKKILDATKNSQDKEELAAIFDHSKHHIFTLMSSDTFRRFLKSPIFEQFLKDMAAQV
jgi:regulator of G-protein signaling 3/regulator of G-protein signaling